MLVYAQTVTERLSECHYTIYRQGGLMTSYDMKRPNVSQFN